MKWIDNSIMRALGRIFDFALLNILWIVCSIPIITIGASTTALYSQMLKIVKNEDGYIFRGYLKAFKENFKQSTILWLIILAVGVVVFIDLWGIDALQIDGELKTVLRTVLSFVMFMLVCLNMYVFPLTARYENTVKQTFKNALLLSVARFPYTLLMLLVTGGSIAIMFLSPEMLATGLVFWLLVGVAVVTWINSYILRRVFRIFEVEKEDNV